MTYVISDLHGQLDSYQKLLEQINFREEDTLYLLGDILDYGSDGIAILEDAMTRPNVFPILGEHEFTAAKLLRRLCEQEKGRKSATPSFQRAFAEWLQKGGMPTVTAFRALDDDARTAILEYLCEECVPYERVSAGGRDFLLVHAGITGYEAEKDLDEYEIRAFIHGDGAFPVNLNGNTVLVTGHTPVDMISPDANGRILFSPYHIAMDCGAADGGFAACLCLETLEAVYA